MKITVLLSAGRHPVSGRPCPVPVELQAVRLGHALGGELGGLHAGASASAVTDALGHGLPRLTYIPLADNHDPLPSLKAALAAMNPDLILAGRIGQGGEDSGLLPYALAHALGMPILADAVALSSGDEDGTLTVEQALPKGVRRRIVVHLPVLVTVHPAAPAPLPFAFGAARRGLVETHMGVEAPMVRDVDERPYRKRPKLMVNAAAGASAADRLKAATQAASGGGKLLVDPAPEDAAREIIAHLRDIGVLRR